MVALWVVVVVAVVMGGGLDELWWAGTGFSLSLATEMTLLSVVDGAPQQFPIASTGSINQMQQSLLGAKHTHN